MFDDLTHGTILVTGGAGFIGSHLVEALLRSGASVRVLDDLSSGDPRNLERAEAVAAAGGGRFQLIVADVRDDFRVRDAVEAEAARFVLVSSCAVYGDPADLPVAETSPPRPLSPYARAKLAAEEACAEAADAGQIAAACLRLFNVYGPRQDPSSPYSGVISRFLAAAGGEGGEAVVYDDGEQTRDFIYVADVCAAIVRALCSSRGGVTTLNVGSGRETSVNALLGAVEGVCGRSVSRRREPAREGDIRRSCADTGRARWVLGWEAGTSLEDGLAATWAALPAAVG